MTFLRPRPRSRSATPALRVGRREVKTRREPARPRRAAPRPKASASAGGHDAAPLDEVQQRRALASRVPLSHWKRASQIRRCEQARRQRPEERRDDQRSRHEGEREGGVPGRERHEAGRRGLCRGQPERKHSLACRTVEQPAERPRRRTRTRKGANERASARRHRSRTAASRPGPMPSAVNSTSAASSRSEASATVSEGSISASGAASRVSTRTASERAVEATRPIWHSFPPRLPQRPRRVPLALWSTSRVVPGLWLEARRYVSPRGGLVPARAPAALSASS
jgi:hypothetical protein